MKQLKLEAKKRDLMKKLNLNAPKGFEVVVLSINESIFGTMVSTQLICKN
jgi:hypothetical protein